MKNFYFVAAIAATGLLLSGCGAGGNTSSSSSINAGLNQSSATVRSSEKAVSSSSQTIISSSSFSSKAIENSSSQSSTSIVSSSINSSSNTSSVVSLSSQARSSDISKSSSSTTTSMSSSNSSQSSRSSSSISNSSFSITSSSSSSSAGDIALHPNIVTPLGVNVENLVDWAKQDVFVDLVKQSRGFGPASAPWNTSAFHARDAQGWPTSDFGIYFFTNRNPGQMAGTYKLVFSGQFQSLHSSGSNAAMQNKIYNPVTNTTTADIIVTNSANTLYLGFVGTQRDANAATNTGTAKIQLLHPGYDENSTQVFMPNFLSALSSFKGIRFNTMTDTVGIPASWSTRSTLQTPIQSTSGNSSLAWEYAIDMANAVNADMWINIPVQADDFYVTQLAQLIKNRLNSSMNVYVEYDNEIWNTIFPQHSVNWNATIAEAITVDSQGNPTGTTSSELNTLIPRCPQAETNVDLTSVGNINAYTNTIRAYRRVARRIKQISDLFATEFGSNAINTRIRPVLAYQASNPYYLEASLCFLNAVYGPPSNYLYAIAGAPYHGLASAVDQSDTLTPDQVVVGLQNNLPNTIKQAAYEPGTSFATFYGLKFMGYEGGSDTGYAHSMVAKMQSAVDPRMESITKDYLDTFHAYGGEMMFYFTLTSNYNDSNFPVYGLMDTQDNPDYPKYRGAMQVVASPKPPLIAGHAVPGTFDGNAFVGSTNPTGNLTTFVANGDFRYYLIRTTTAGNYSLVLNASNSNSGSNVNVQAIVNNGTAIPISVAPAASGVYSDTNAVTINLKQGLNVIRLRFPGTSVPVAKLKIN